LCIEPSRRDEGDDDDATNSRWMDESLKESNRELNTTVMNLKESINHLKEVNKDLEIKYDKQKDFISIAAHELRSPIMPILGTLELIEYEFEREDKTEITLKKESFDRLINNTNRLERLVSEILDITRIEDQSLRLKKEPFNLNESVLDAIEDHRRQIEKSNRNTKLLFEFKNEDQEKVPRTADISPEDVVVNADKNRINQVINNLLTNAIKFTEDGTISVSVIKKQRKNHIDEIILGVKDTGAGIHPDILPRLFSKFATGSDVGTGLGLYISKSIVEAHGGKIWAENNPGNNGATFTFSLPLNCK